MLNKKDPLIDAIQQVMQSNQADRDAVKAVNEKFGIQDRRVLPHERQGEWDAAYKTVLSEGVEALEEKSFAALAPPYDKATHKDKLVGAGVLKKHPTEPGKHVLAKEEKKMKGDDPCWDTHEMIGMKKGKGGKPVPNCVPVSEEGDPSKAIPGDTVTGGSSVTPVPKPKTQAPAEPRPVGQDDQSKLKTMIQNIKEAKKAAMYEGSMKKTMGEFKRGKLHSGSKTGPIVKSRDQAIAIGMNNEETVNRTGKGNLQEPQTVASGKDSISPEATSKNNNAPGPSFERTGRGAAPSAPQARTNPGISALNRPAPTPARNSPEGGSRPPAASAPTPQAGPNRGLGPKPAAPGSAPVKAPVTTAKPADGDNAAKPAQKLKPVRKQPNTGTVKRPGVPARPVTKGSVLDRVKRDRMRNKNNEVGPGN
jgi:hypothetical protein